MKTGLELSLMIRYFIFQVVHSFLVVSGIIAALPGISEDPSSIATLLAQDLPQGFNFILTYIILQGLSGTGAGFLQIVVLIMYYVKLFILGSTPRSIYDIKFGMVPSHGALYIPQPHCCHCLALLVDISHHQWTCLRYFLPLFPVLEVPVLVAAR